MGLKYLEYLEGKKVYGCLACRSHLATNDEIISKDFHGQHGKAYLLHNLTNVDILNDTHEEIMRTGKHDICSVACSHCATLLGWKYVTAHDVHQKYKEGKFVLEKSLLRIIYEE